MYCLFAGDVLVVLIQHGLPLRGRGGVRGLHGYQGGGNSGDRRHHPPLDYHTMALHGERDPTAVVSPSYLVHS